MLQSLIRIIFWQLVTPFRQISIIGVFLLFSIVLQIITGTLISFGAINDCILLPQAREEDDMGDLYNDDFYYYHERGVDFIFIFLYLHIFRKLFLKAQYVLQQTAWKSGALMYLLIHGIIFFGLVLCCTHLSDITLKIAANIAQTLTFKYGKIGYWLFTDNTLNTDTLIRLMYIHYILPFILLFISVSHLLDMHYNWKDSSIKKWFYTYLQWITEVLPVEFLAFINILFFFKIITSFLYSKSEPLSYEIFMWGDIGMVNDVRFLGVAPHWYFRPYMSWLIFCPHHYIGIFGLIFFFMLIYLQINIHKFVWNLSQIKLLINFNENSIFHKNFYFIFILSMLYSGSYLPCGKFFTLLKGNYATALSFFFIYFYLLSNIENYVYTYSYNYIFYKKKKLLFYFL